jgi:DNA-binding NarL/FixJ family response regulator
VFTATAYDAICALNARDFDAYVLPFWLPDWSSFSLCRDVRKADPHAPIVFYGSGAREPNCKRARRAGASACVPDGDMITLRGELRTLLDRVCLENLAAITAEQRAIQEELERRAAVLAGRADRAKHMAALAVERTAKIKACAAYTAEGGTRADFMRRWPQAFGMTMREATRQDSPAGAPLGINRPR